MTGVENLGMTGAMVGSIINEFDGDPALFWRLRLQA